MTLDAVAPCEIPGGFRLGQRLVDGKLVYVDMLRMAYNWRVMTAGFHVRHWCYSGTGEPSRLRAGMFALEWLYSPARDEPRGWNKNGQTGVFRPPHPCPDCHGTIHPILWDGGYLCYQCDDNADQLLMNGEINA